MAPATSKRRLSPQRMRAVRRRRRRRHIRAIVLSLGLLALAAGLVAALSFVVSTCVRSVERRGSDTSGELATNMLRTSVSLPSQQLAKSDAALMLEAGQLVAGLTTEQRVAQLFIVTPESLLAVGKGSSVTSAGDYTREALRERPVGGIIYFEKNLVDAEQTSQMLATTQSYSLESCGIPLMLSVDEEGGTVSRVGGNAGFDIANVGDMRDVGATGDDSYARDVAADIGSYLHQLGFTANLAPVADVANNPASDIMTLRSFGSDAQLVSRMVAAQVQGMRSQQVISCAKHFPGIGGAEGDSHDGAIYTDKSAEQMAQEELLPFAAAIDAGVPMVMVGHISCPQLTGNDLPASVSSVVMQDLLRDQMGFDGVIVTDSLEMGAIASIFGNDRVAVEAFLAGADALLMPADFDAAYQGMLDAVESGEVSEERLALSAWRIVWMKLQYDRR